MKYYKRQPINRQSPMNSAFAVEADGRIVTNTRRSLEIPDGPTSSRPMTALNGMLRYNTDINNFEAYIDGQWQLLVANTQAQITKQVFENGDYADTIFGPLAYDIALEKAENIFVYVENVPQMADLNYSLVYGSTSTPYTTSTFLAQPVSVNTNTLYLESVADFNPGYVISGSGIPLGTTIVSSSGTALTVVLSNEVTAPVSSGTEVTVYYSSGTYVKFSDNSVPVPHKPVIVLLGFDGYNPPFVPT